MHSPDSVLLLLEDLLMTIPRKNQIDLAETRFYHCISRCTQQSFLLGDDTLTKHNYDHRKTWVITQLNALCSVFAIQVCAYAVMSNHYHLVLHIAPERVNEWSDEEVILRSATINTLRVSGRFLTQEEKNKLSIKPRSKEEIEKMREKLFNISQFMAGMNQYLSRRANQETNRKGTFWDKRFSSVSLLDDAAVLSCMAYVDLNPVRAGMANSLEESDFTSIQERLRSYAQVQVTGVKPLLAPKHEQPLLTPFATPNGKSPIPCSLEDYINLVEWTGRQFRDGKASLLQPVAVSVELQVMLKNVGISPEHWLHNATSSETKYARVMGSFETLKNWAKKKGLGWVRGMRGLVAKTDPLPQIKAKPA
jgi:REP element-mobilizing transposase RayT